MLRVAMNLAQRTVNETKRYPRDPPVPRPVAMTERAGRIPYANLDMLPIILSAWCEDVADS